MIGVVVSCMLSFFFFQAEDGIRDLVRSRGLGDVYKRQLIPIKTGTIEFDGKALKSANTNTTPYERARAGIGLSLIHI